MKIRNSLILIFLAVIIIQILGEKIPYNDGAGWDGLYYRDVAYDFLPQAREDGFNHYMTQRLLPFALLHLVFDFFDLPFQNDTLMTGILVMNFLALLLALWWYLSLVSYLGISQNIQILGFMLLFINFPLMKVTWYEPFVTDLFAFMIGVGQLNFFVRKKKVSLILLTIISGFIWPTSLIIGLMLFFFPEEKPILSNDVFKFKNWMFLIPIIVGGLLVFGFFEYSTRPNKPITELYRHLISLFVIFLFFYGILKNLNLDWKKNAILFFNKKNWTNLTLFGISVFIFYVFIARISNAEPSFGIKPFLAFLVIRPIQLPFNFLVNHFLYFGMLIPICIFYFKEVFAKSSEMGLSFILLFFATILLGLNSESRMIINLVPFLVLPVLMFIKNSTFAPIVFIVIGTINLFLSKFWYSINVSGIEEAFETYDTEVYMQFPAQRYFQHFGPWQNPKMYLLYGIGLILALLLIKYYQYQRTSSHIKSRPIMHP